MTEIQWTIALLIFTGIRLLLCICLLIFLNKFVCLVRDGDRVKHNFSIDLSVSFVLKFLNKFVCFFCSQISQQICFVSFLLKFLNKFVCVFLNFSTKGFLLFGTSYFSTKMFFSLVRDGDTVKHYRIRQLDKGGFFITLLIFTIVFVYLYAYVSCSFSTYLYVEKQFQQETVVAFQQQ